MSYKEKPQLKLYSYSNNEFVLRAVIDDYAECSFERNLYQAGIFTITINFNIPNSQLFQRGLFIQFGNDPYDFGEIYSIQDSIGEDGKGSQLRTITGYDARYLFKRRVIKNLNANGMWQMTDKGEIVMRNLINDQCGVNAELRRRLPINNVLPENAIGKDFSVSEAFSNLYEVCVTIATQSEIGWRVRFEEGELTLEVYSGQDKSATVRFDTSYDSLANGEFKDSAEAFANTVYVGGKGTGNDRDIYEGESAIEGSSPSGLDRFEAWDNQSSMTTESEYEAEATSMLNQYGQTLQVSGQGLAKCPYEYGKEYNVGDIITIAFSGKSAIVQILSITEHWSFGAYDLQFSFGKPQPDLNKQLQLILKQIQKASNKTSSTDSVRWYTIPTDIEMPSSDVIYNTIGFIGNCASGGSTFKLYLDDQKTGAKTYHVYFKQLGGGKLTLTTGKAGATDLVMNSGTYVAIIYVDALGNVSMAGASVTNSIESGNNQPASSDAVYNAIQSSSGYGTPLGTWASFENDSAPNGEWIQGGTTFDANTYPAMAMMLGGNTVPERFDHNRLGDYEDITLPTSSASAITMEYDGVFDIQINGTIGQQTNIYFYVNSNLITQTSKSGTYIIEDRSDFSFKKGDVIYVTVSGGSITTKVRYYKHPMFIKATPTSSDSDYEGTLNSIRTYVSNSNSYSTDETPTGGTWIDGKPIYRKTYYSATNWANGATIDTVPDVDMVITIKQIASDNSSYREFYTDFSNGIGVGYFIATGQIRVFRSGSFATSRPSLVIFEYTKTTD